VRGEGRQGNLCSIGCAFRQRDERMRLSLPVALGRRRPRFRGQSVRNDGIAGTAVSERVHRDEDDVQAVVVQGLEQGLASLIARGTSRPGADRFVPDHERAVGEKIADAIEPFVR
jgi:hypothetical protein